MRNYINKNIDTSIKWKRSKKRIDGLLIFDKSEIVGRKSRRSWSDTKDFPNPTGHCGSIEITDGTLMIWTNGKYQFIKKEIAIKLFKELLKMLEGKDF